MITQKRRARREISDSGASKCMFNDKSKFRNFKPCHNVSIRVAEGSSAKVLDTGDVGALTSLLHVEDLLFDLVSELALSRASMSSSWFSLSRIVEYSEGKIFLEATPCDDILYEVNPMQ